MHLLLKHLTLLLLAICSFALVSATAAESELPAAAKAALEKLDKSEGKLTAEHKKAVAAERIKTISELQKVMKEVTKTGDLDTANAVKAKIDELIAKNDAAEDTDLLGNKKKVDYAKMITGSWDWQQANGVAGSMEIFADGRLVAKITSPKEFPFVPGKWEAKDDKILLTWLHEPAKVNTLTFTSPTKMTGEAADQGKNSFNLTKQPPAK